MLSKDTHQNQRYKQVKRKRMENYIHANSDNKKAAVTKLMSAKINFKTKMLLDLKRDIL